MAEYSWNENKIGPQKSPPFSAKEPFSENKIGWKGTRFDRHQQQHSNVDASDLLLMLRDKIRSYLVCRSVLQCVAVCCSVLQCVAVCCRKIRCYLVSMHRQQIGCINVD